MKRLVITWPVREIEVAASCDNHQIVFDYKIAASFCSIAVVAAKEYIHYSLVERDPHKRRTRTGAGGETREEPCRRRVR
jgi:hypothetical protein